MKKNWRREMGKKGCVASLENHGYVIVTAITISLFAVTSKKENKNRGGANSC
jgi:hypothetical protein